MVMTSHGAFPDPFPSMEGTKLSSYWCLLRRNSSLLGVLSVDMCSSKYIGVTV